MGVLNVAATFRSPEGQHVVSQSWRRKNNRLDAENYVGSNAYLVTVATDGRIDRFIDGSLVRQCVSRLLAAAATEGMEVLAYVFMPDHLHLLLMGSDVSNLARFIKRFKQETGYGFKHRSGDALWQKGYHDHILRHEEDLNDVARYVAANPVRAGLVLAWDEYPYTGGTLLDGALDGDLKVAATSGEVVSGEAPA